MTHRLPVRLLLSAPGATTSEERPLTLIFKDTTANERYMVHIGHAF